MEIFDDYFQRTFIEVNMENFILACLLSQYIGVASVVIIQSTLDESKTRYLHTALLAFFCLLLSRKNLNTKFPHLYLMKTNSGWQ